MVNVDLTELPKLTNHKFYPMHKDKSRYLVLMGGGGSGKSVFIAQKIILRVLNEKKHRILVLRKVAKTLRESVYQELKNVIYRWGLEKLFKIHKGELLIECINGNQILFAGLDDVEKLKSISGITSIWIEEASEITPEDFRQLDIRLRGKTKSYKQMMITFNPISVNHWLKAEFFDSKKPNATVVHSTYKDNRFLDEEAKRVLEGFKETDYYYYTVYCLGQWGVIGKTVFNAQIVQERIQYLQQQPEPKRGSFVFDYKNERIVDSSIKFVEDEQGFVTIYEKPVSKTPYVIGGDTAEGGMDSSCGQVLNNITGAQSAVWHGHLDTDLFAKQMYCLGRYYNNALIAIETNFDLHPVKELQRLKYPRQFKREIIDRITNQKQTKYGFMTTKVTRPVIIGELVSIVRESVELINDIPTLNEMLSFVRNEDGKPEAMEGAHDDRILALAIAYKARSQQSMSLFEDYAEPEYTPSFGRTGY